MNTSKISSVTDPETGHVTLYLSDVKGGPVITGKNYTDAMSRWQEAMALYHIANFFLNEDQA